MSNDDRLYNTLEKMDQRLDNVDITLAKQSVVLEQHVKRTNLLEDEIRPIKKHVDRVNAIMWLMSGILTLLLAAKSLGLF